MIKNQTKTFYAVFSLDDEGKSYPQTCFKVFDDESRAMYDAECEVGERYRRIELKVLSDALYDYKLVPVKKKGKR